MEFHTSGTQQMLAVGDDQGTVHVLQIPRNLRRSPANERQFISAFIAREEQRVAYVKRQLAETAEERQAGKAGGDAPVPVADKGDDDEEDKLELAFRALEETFVEEMGLKPPEEEAPAADP